MSDYATQIVKAIIVFEGLLEIICGLYILSL
jgi:hypothetical protein